MTRPRWLPIGILAASAAGIAFAVWVFSSLTG
jgi:hypothetical protein